MEIRCFRCSKQCETGQRSQGYPRGLGRPQLEEDPLVVHSRVQREVDETMWGGEGMCS